MKAMILEEGKLFALAEIGDPFHLVYISESQEACWPSWCPYWHEVRINAELGFPNQPFQVANLRPMALDKISRSERVGSFPLDGFAIDTVTQVVDILVILTFMNTNQWEPHEVIPMLARKLQQELLMDKKMSHETMLMLLAVGGPPWLSQFRLDKEKTLKQMTRDMSRATASVGSEDTESEPKLTSQAAKEIIRKIATYSELSCAFATERGRLGLGPSTTAQRDKLTVLLGGSWPILLTPEGSHFLLRGPYYVDGIMGGEAVQECVANHREPETFEFR